MAISNSLVGETFNRRLKFQFKAAGIEALFYLLMWYLFCWLMSSNQKISYFYTLIIVLHSIKRSSIAKPLSLACKLYLFEKSDGQGFLAYLIKLYGKSI